MIIVSPSSTEEELKQITNGISNFITSNGGEIANVDEWGKKRLAYEIKDQREGYYFVFYYSFEPTKINELDRYLKLNENVLRHNILVK
jgi:small subunit ribosomal protein S6